MDFQSFSKTVLLLKFPLYTGVPGLFYSSEGEAPAVHPMVRGGGVGLCEVARALGRWW
jgi:hypothetical protein